MTSLIPPEIVQLAKHALHRATKSCYQPYSDKMITLSIQQFYYIIQVIHHIIQFYYITLSNKTTVSYYSIHCYYVVIAYQLKGYCIDMLALSYVCYL